MQSADKRDNGKSGADKGPQQRMMDPQVHTNFSYNLNACVVQGSRDDRDATPTNPGVVERVWIVSRPPRLGRGVEPTVSARRAHVMLTHVQGQTIDAGEMVCKNVCAPATAGTNEQSPASQVPESCRGQTCG